LYSFKKTISMIYKPTPKIFIAYLFYFNHLNLYYFADLFFRISINLVHNDPKHLFRLEYHSVLLDIFLLKDDKLPN